MNIQQELEINFVFSLVETFVLAFTVYYQSKLTEVFFYVFLLNLSLHFMWKGFIYPFCFHPLRVLPTPPTWFPQVRLVYDVPRGKSLLQMMRTVPNNGLIHFRDLFNQSYILPTSHRALHDILCSQQTYGFEKSPKLRAFMAEIVGNGVVVAEGDMHKQQRRAINPAFSTRNIRMLTGFMWEKTKVFLHEIENDMRRNPMKDSPSTVVGKVEMGKWTSRLTLDVIGASAMGHDFATLSNPGTTIVDTFLAILEPTFAKLTYLAMRLMLPESFIRALPWNLNKVVEGNRGSVRRKCLEIIHVKRQTLARSSINRKDLEGDILGTVMQNAGFTDENLVDQMMTLLAAGHDTTAHTLSWCCYELCRNPDLQERVRQEVLANIPHRDQPIGWEVLESLPLLGGVCEETVRLYPTIPITFREAFSEAVVAGYKIPKGTYVAISPYAINRSLDFWGPTADEFQPDRWLSVDGQGNRSFNRTGGATSQFGLISFLHGPRTCLGKEFARLEMRCALAGLVGQFRMELQDPTKEILLGGGLTTKPVGGMNLKLTKLDW